jgi:hypothetical protein
MNLSNNRARVSLRHWSAWAICDFCFKQVQRTDLVPDRQYMGTEVRPTGFLVCKYTCVDRPQPQQKAIRIPPDPLPVQDPRVDNFATGLFGFTQYGLVPDVYGLFNKASVLSQIATLSGVATPAYYMDISLSLTAANTSETITAAAAYGPQPVIGISGNPVIGINGSVVISIQPAAGNGSPRNWFALFNPGNSMIELAMASTVAYGGSSNLVLGSGCVLFWADAQGYGQTYQGAMSAIVPNSPVPLWGWVSTQAINP